MMPGPIAVKLRVLREERGLTHKEVAELTNVSQWTLIYLGVRQATSTHAHRDEDSQGIRGACRGVGGGVFLLTIPKVAPICRFSGASLCANFALTEFA